MGKSEKKAKLDRINALRKQYDAFLENERKRKERNEYILGKLDKMRFSDSLVKVKTAPAYSDVVNSNNASYSANRNFSQPTVQCIQNKSPVRFISKDPEESLVLKELSKKYILIPRLKTVVIDDNSNELFTSNINNPISTSNNNDENNVSRSNNELNVSSVVNDNPDWKSKYEILNQLKKYEKEGETDQRDDSSHDESFNEDNVINTEIKDKDSLKKVEPRNNTKTNDNPNESPIEEYRIPNVIQQIGDNNFAPETVSVPANIGHLESETFDLPEKTDLEKDITDDNKKFLHSNNLIPNLEPAKVYPEDYKDPNYQGFLPDHETISKAATDTFNFEDSNYSMQENYEKPIQDLNYGTNLNDNSINKNNIETSDGLPENCNQFQERANINDTMDINNSNADTNYSDNSPTEITETFNEMNQPCAEEPAYQYEQEATESMVDNPVVENEKDYQYNPQTNNPDNANEFNTGPNNQEPIYQYEQGEVENAQIELSQDAAALSGMESAYQYDNAEMPINNTDPNAGFYAQSSDVDNSNEGVLNPEPEPIYYQENAPEVSETKNDLYQYDANGQYQYYEGAEQYPVEGNEQDNQYDPNYVQQYEGEDYSYNQPEYAEVNQENNENSETMQEMTENPVYDEGNLDQIQQQIFIEQSGDTQQDQVVYQQPEAK